MFKEIPWKKGLDIAKELLQDYLHPTLPATKNYLEFYSGSGLVDEESLAACMTYALSGGCHVGIIGKSGCGKSTLASTILQAFEEVYTFEFSTQKAIFYDDEINKASIIYVPELQKLKGTATTEVLKNLGEKRDVHYKRVLGQTIEEHTITSGASIVFTLADENTYEIEKELARRCVLLYMNSTEQQTRKVLQGMVEKRDSSFDTSQLQKHSKIARSLDDLINPYASYMANYVPATLDARSQFSHLLRLYQGCAKLNYQNRYVNGSMQVIIDDIQEVHNVYWKQFCHAIGAEKPMPNKDDLLKNKTNDEVRAHPSN